MNGLQAPANRSQIPLVASTGKKYRRVPHPRRRGTRPIVELGEGKSAPGFVPVGEVDVGAGFTDGEIEVEHA